MIDFTLLLAITKREALPIIGDIVVLEVPICHDNNDNVSKY